MKPAQIAAVAEALREAVLRPDAVLISILAGVSTERLEQRGGAGDAKYAVHGGPG